MVYTQMLLYDKEVTNLPVITSCLNCRNNRYLQISQCKQQQYNKNLQTTPAVMSVWLLNNQLKQKLM